MCKRIIGYTRDIIAGDGVDTRTQIKMILDFCNHNNFQCSKIYCDVGIRENRHADEVQRAKEIGISCTKARNIYPQWEEMMIDVLNDNIQMIIVDCIYRLYSNKEQREALYRICNEHHVEIVEVKYSNPPADNAKKKVAFYHFTIPRKNADDIRTTGILRDIGTMYSWASKHEGWEPTALYIDTTADRRKEYPLLAANNDIDIIVVKNFYHIKRKIVPFLNEVRMYQAKGVRIVSVEEGELLFRDEIAVYLREAHKVAVYEKIEPEVASEHVKLMREMLDLFFSCKAKKWVIGDYFIDNKESRSGLDNLIKRGNEFDMILVNSFDLFEDISVLYGVIQRTGLPIYSMREGAILYENLTDKI